MIMKYIFREQKTLYILKKDYFKEDPARVSLRPVRPLLRDKGTVPVETSLYQKVLLVCLYVCQLQTQTISTSHNILKIYLFSKTKEEICYLRTSF